MPIDGGRLAAALAQRKWTARVLAEKAQLPDSTIHYLTSGTREQCRRSVRAAVARVLGYDAEWLGGERPDLPLPAGWRRPGLHFPTTPRAYLAAWELLAAVFKRLAREPRMADDAAARFVDKLLDVLDPRTWRENLVRPRPSRPPQQRRDVRPAEMEVAVPALAEALTVILAGWLRRDAVEPRLDALAGLLPLGARQQVLTPGASAVLPPLDGAAREDTSNPDGLTAAERNPDRFLPPLGAPGHVWQKDKEVEVPRGSRQTAITAGRTLRVSGRAEAPVPALTWERLELSPEELAAFNALAALHGAPPKVSASRRRSAPRSDRR